MKNNNNTENLTEGTPDHFCEAVLNSMPDIIGVQDNQHRIIRYNQAGYKFLNKSQEEVSGKRCYELIGRNAVCDNCPTEKCYKTKLPAQSVKYFPDLKIWLDIRAYPQLDSNGNVCQVIEHLRDITLQKEAEQKVLQAKKEWENIFEAIGHPTAILDRQHKIINVNKAVLKASGRSKDEIVGMNCYEIFHSKEQKTPSEGCPLNCMIASERFESVEMEMEAFCGTYLVSCTPIFNEQNQLKYVIHIATEITDRKNAENELNKFKFMIENSGQEVYLVKPEGELVYVNKAVAESLKYSRDEIMKMRIADFDPEYGKNYFQHFKELKEKELAPFETSHIDKNGSIIPKEIKSRYLKIEENEFVCGFGSDISNRKTTESELVRQKDEIALKNQEYLKLNEELRNAVSELNEAKNKAEESDKLKSAFLANISHEIRTPMNGLIGFAQMISKPQLTEEKRIKYAEIINNSCKQLLSIVNDILDISRIETNQVQLYNEEINLVGLMNEIFDFYSPAVYKKGLEFRINYSGISDQAKLISDYLKIKQVLSNLLNNAIKYTEKGSIEIGCICRKCFVEFYIKDTGSGIKQEYHQVIFDRFRQADNKPVIGGTGLGLAICKAYIEKLGGSISLESEFGSGSRFFFTLPVFCDASAEQTTSL